MSLRGYPILGEIFSIGEASATICPVSGLVALAEHNLAHNRVENTTFFEPHHLKDFVAGIVK
jgi:hypothetical protein